MSFQSCIDTILVPQGAEYQAIYRGSEVKTQFSPKIMPIPVGILPLRHYLNQWQQTKEFINHPPMGILLMGLGGSLSPSYEVGETILVHECCLMQDETFPQKWLTCGRDLSVLLYHHLQEKARWGRGVTSDRVITSAQQKSLLGERYQADVVDMEGVALLEFCNPLRIPVTIIRVISDNCQQDLPDLTSALGADGRLNPWKLGYQMAKKPINSLHLIRGSLKGLGELQRVTQAIFS